MPLIKSSCYTMLENNVLDSDQARRLARCGEDLFIKKGAVELQRPSFFMMLYSLLSTVSSASPSSSVSRRQIQQVGCNFAAVIFLLPVLQCNIHCHPENSVLALVLPHSWHGLRVLSTVQSRHTGVSSSTPTFPLVSALSRVLTNRSL